MEIGKFFPLILCGLIFSFTLNIIYFIKEHIKNEETKIFTNLLVFNFFGLLGESICSFIGYNFPENSLIAHLATKIYLISLMIFMLFMTLYMFVLCYVIGKNERYNYYTIIKKISNCVLLLSIIILFVLPIETGRGYAVGASVNFTFGMFTFVLIIWGYSVLKNIKEINKKKLFPLLLFTLFLTIIAIIQKKYPEVTLTTVMDFLVVFIMYHTIENPDVKMLEEYQKNRELTEINIEEKSNTLFKISEDVKSPIRKINLLSNKISKSDELTEIHTDAKNIDIISNNVLNTINDVLDISLMDKQKIKTISSTYNIYNLFNQIVYIVKSKVEGFDTFKYSISNTLPEKIYGDSTKLKQIICSIILRTYKTSKKGIIDLDISSIIKNNVCRLVITIQDTGTYLSLDKINELLDSDYELDKNIKVDELDIDLKITKKIIDVLGGTIFVKSDEDEGTAYTVVINQIIDSEKSEPLTKFLSNKKRAMVVDDNYKELEVIANELKRNNYEVISTMYGKDCIDRIDNDEKYDLIFVNDEMQGYNAVKVITELDLEKIKQTKVIVMLDKSKEFIKEHYLEDYPFDDYLLKSSLKDEIERIKDKY